MPVKAGITFNRYVWQSSIDNLVPFAVKIVNSASGGSHDIKSWGIYWLDIRRIQFLGINSAKIIIIS